MDQLKETSCYEFQRLLFGLNSVSFETQYIPQKNTKENQKEFPIAAETVLQSIYMGDSRDSMTNEDEELKLIQKLKVNIGISMVSFIRSVFLCVV